LGKKSGLDDSAMKSARLGQATDRKTAAAVTLAQKLVNTRGVVAEPDIVAARAAGLDDGDMAEVVANVALNIFTNYFNNMNQTEVDFPKVPVEIQ
jgi:alkylhydroperoxidase family enzyme